MRVLLVEDDNTIAVPLVKGLEREGFEVTHVTTGHEAVAASPPDVMLLDVRLPDIDGYEVCRRVRIGSDVPIVFLTARGDEIDRVVGLELGADDYVVKPFGFRELVARIKAVTRRRQTPPEPRVGAGGLEVDRRTRRAALHGSEVELTPKEFDVLAVLAEDPGAVVPRQQLLERVWGHAWYGPTKTLDVHVAAIRKKLGDPAWIEAVRGVGTASSPRRDQKAPPQLRRHHRLGARAPRRAAGLHRRPKGASQPGGRRASRRRRHRHLRHWPPGVR